MQYFGSNIVEGVAESWVEVEMSWVEMDARFSNTRFEVKCFSYTYSSFKRNDFMESKIIEYGISLLDKYKVELTEVISRLLFTFLLANYKKV